MPITAVEVHQARQRMQELIDTILSGQEVVFTHFGEPVGVVGLRRFGQEEPPPWIRSTMAKVIEDALGRLRGHLDLPPWRLN
jgi:antitoxin (DNA-binding transcriptional repressor) of toxin-antitoxin stability system